jgi:Arc/MetJ family transcription regulator
MYNVMRYSMEVPIWYFSGRHAMRVTVSLDDELVAKAGELTGIVRPSDLIRAALVALVERSAARRLAELGGSAPDLEPPPRRRPT